MKRLKNKDFENDWLSDEDTLVKLKQFSLIKNRYMIFDTDKYLIMNTLINNGITLRNVEMYESDKVKYNILIFSVYKWQYSKVVDILHNTISVIYKLGYSDYKSTVKHFYDVINNF